MIRIASIHLERNSPEADLRACLQQIDDAASTHRPTIVVCPELTLAEPEQGGAMDALREAVAQFAESARRHGVFLALSLAASGSRVRTWITPEGSASHDPEADEVILVESPFGRLGLCAGLTLFESEAVRRAAEAGARLICAPLALCPAPKAALHVAARASENGVFVATATVFESIAESPAPGEELGQPVESVRGSVSQIVDPSGRTLSLAVIDHSGVAVAEVALAGDEDAPRPAPERRPELYRASLARPRRGRTAREATLDVATLDVSAAEYDAEPLTDSKLESKLDSTLERAAEAVRELAASGARLIALPALLGLEATSDEQARLFAARFGATVRALAEACEGTAAHLVTSWVEEVEGDLTHVGLVIGAAGIVARQQQLHAASESWMAVGRRIECVPLPWGNLALAIGSDALAPELLVAERRLGADLIVAVLSAGERRTVLHSLPALADELAVPIVAAAPGSSEADEGPALGGAIIDPRAWPARRAQRGERTLRVTVTLPADGATRSELAAAAS